MNNTLIHIAWTGWRGRRGRPTRYSLSHLSQDNGKTTLCGIRVPQDAFDYDYSGNADQCLKCARIRKEGTK